MEPEWFQNGIKWFQIGSLKRLKAKQHEDATEEQPPWIGRWFFEPEVGRRVGKWFAK